MVRFSSCGGDYKVLLEIEKASEKAVLFSDYADFAKVLQHQEAIELHRYVLRLVATAYNIFRIGENNIVLEKELKSVFVYHQEYLRAHQRCLQALSSN